MARDNNHIPETVLQMASELRLDVLLESPVTQDTVVRFICSVRKDLMEAQVNDNDSMATIETERLLSRMYHQIGYDRRNSAFARNSRAAA